MDDTSIIEMLYEKFSANSGRHIYGALGSYPALKRFSQRLREAKLPAPLSITRGILDSIPDEDFRSLVEEEAKRPVIVRGQVADAFKKFVDRHLYQERIVILEGLELLYTYNIDLAPFRTLPIDDIHLLLLLPGHYNNGAIRLFPQQEREYWLPSQLITPEHLWEVQE